VVTGELRAQRREPCVESGWAADKRCNPRLFNGDQRCDGCNGDGTRWVTVGELRQRLRHLGREVGRALYVIEETS
jgi:hypothetical protein